MLSSDNLGKWHHVLLSHHLKALEAKVRVIEVVVVLVRQIDHLVVEVFLQSSRFGSFDFTTGLDSVESSDSLYCLVGELISINTALTQEK